MKMLFEYPALAFTHLISSRYTRENIELVVARLDQLHPVISGNKLFKLHFFLERALASIHKTVITFGGAWSNHLLATAYACNRTGLKSIGIIRGEKPAVLSNTLKSCEAYGMRLEFISRSDYKDKDQTSFINRLFSAFDEAIIIPEGGYQPLGAKGASLIMDLLSTLNATHICTATGTGTTLAGLIQNKQQNETIIGVPVLKDMKDIHQRILFLNGKVNNNDFILFDEYHFGGYAKKTAALLHFMNELYREHQLPTDFVYTAKMMYAIIDKIQAGYFPEGSKIVCLHTGGLQGNASLPGGALIF